MFGSIAARYDRANALLSFCLHKIWNRALVKRIAKAAPVGDLLDLASGTGDIAFAFRKIAYARVTLLDFCPEMLAVARCKAGALDGLTFQCADAQALPFADHSYDAATMAYGLRNVADPHLCAQEVWRVLRPGAIWGILELTRPRSALLRFGHRLYLKTLLPLLGRWIATDGQAYRYLSSSISAFLAPAQIESMLKETGFKRVWSKPLLGGVATLIFAQK